MCTLQQFLLNFLRLLIFFSLLEAGFFRPCLLWSNFRHWRILSQPATCQSVPRIKHCRMLSWSKKASGKPDKCSTRHSLKERAAGLCRCSYFVMAPFDCAVWINQSDGGEDKWTGIWWHNRGLEEEKKKKKTQDLREKIGLEVLTGVDKVDFTNKLKIHRCLSGFN